MTQTWTSAELDDVRHRLLEDRDVLQERLIAHQPLEVICGDVGDHANQAMEAELDDLSAERDRLVLEQTAAVLDRLDRGVYDRCEQCGDVIARERLEAFPRATWCLSCARQEQVR